MILSSLFPQDSDGVPSTSSTGKYHLRILYNGAYRRVRDLFVLRAALNDTALRAIDRSVGRIILRSLLAADTATRRRRRSTALLSGRYPYVRLCRIEGPALAFSGRESGQ